MLSVFSYNAALVVHILNKTDNWSKPLNNIQSICDINTYKILYDGFLHTFREKINCWFSQRNRTYACAMPEQCYALNNTEMYVANTSKPNWFVFTVVCLQVGRG